MSAFNSRDSYGWVAIAMHWLMAIAVVAMFASGIWMRSLGYYDAWYHDAPYIHKSFGILLLLLFVFRMVWRWINIRPQLMGKLWEQVIALWVHRSHYLLLFIVLMSGYFIPTAEGVGIEVFHIFTVPALWGFSKDAADMVGMIHLYGAWLLIMLALLHALAALKHHLMDKDDTLLRMLGCNDSSHH